MRRFKTLSVALTALFTAGLLLSGLSSSAFAQEEFPEDNGLWDYHRAPEYRESESHPLRIVAYILHPIGWVAREAIFRPLSYFASSTEVTRSVMGYREPFDFRKPSCYSADSSTPDCHALPPFNYNAPVATNEESVASVTTEARQVYFPDVNFNFNSHKLTDLGEGRVHQIGQLLTQSPGLKIVLEGNTDYVGGDKFNEKLGMDRAEAVRERLVALGVPSDRLSSVTFGLSKPVFSEKENWARAVNRRVSVHAGEEMAAAGSAS